MFYSHITSVSLADFPVVNKEIIRKQQNKFISKHYSKSELITIYTSGSTGMPFCSYQDRNKKKHVIAELIFYSEKTGYTLGNPLIQIRGETPIVRDLS